MSSGNTNRLRHGYGIYEAFSSHERSHAAVCFASRRFSKEGMTAGQFFKNLLAQEGPRGFILGAGAFSGGGSLGTVLSRIPRPRAV